VIARLPLRVQLLLLDLGYCVGELVQVGVERTEKTLDCEPLNAAASSLDARDVGRVNRKSGGKLLLSDPGAVAQGAQCAPEDDQVSVSGGLFHDGQTWYSGSGCAMLGPSNIVPPRCENSRGRGTESSSSRRIGSLPSRIGCLPRQSCLPEPPTKEEPMMTTIPADAVLRLREALYSQLGDVAEELASADRRPGREIHDEWSTAVARFDRTRALLDEIGWSERDPEHDVEIDLDAHRQAIVAALSEQLEAEHYLMAEQGQAVEKQRERARCHALTIEAFMAATGLERE
jgi:hypothetical protein